MNFQRMAQQVLAWSLAMAALGAGPLVAAELPWIVVSRDAKGFELEKQGQPFRVWGFNYDHDEKGRLIEDYWEAEWPKVERDFQSMKKLGANVVRIHLQVGKFMEGPEQPRAKSLARLERLVGLAEKVGLYLDLTGLGCYHKADVPAWYDSLDEAGRWRVQAQFWRAVAKTCAASPAIFCYDLMNEPVVPGGKRAAGEWLGPAFAGKHFVQFVTLDQAARPRHEIAMQWIRPLVAAIREHDQRHLVTVGLVDWSASPRSGLTSGFVPEKIASELDFLCVHLYPEKDKMAEAAKTLQEFAVGKPLVVEETFPLKCSMPEFEQFLEMLKKNSAGGIGFYWGQTPDELRASKTLGDAITLAWLELFQKHAPANNRP